MYGMTRGETNNNPLNIRLSPDQFQGEIIPSLDSSFKQFTSALFGIRAGAVILGNYYKLHHLNTVRQIINRWAPNSENNTDSYVKDVCKHMQCTPDSPLDFTVDPTMEDLIAAIIYHENGEDIYTLAEIRDAISMVSLHYDA